MLEEDVGILNATRTEQSSVGQTIVFPQTMQMQREIFVLKGDYITPQDAEDFYEQAQRLPRLRINECMQRQAIDLVHVKIMTDVTHFTEMTQEQRFESQTVLNIEYVAKLIMQYFGTSKQGDHGDHTLAKLFAKVPFHYSLNFDEEELSTYMAYKELVSGYERTRRITPTQNVELVTILKKRLARGSRVQSDYFESKRADTVSPRTWEPAMMRVVTVVCAAREAIRMSRSYGNADVIYSFPSTAVPPLRWSKKRGSTLAIREAEPPSGKSTLAVRTSLDAPLIAARLCCSCGNPAHMLPTCPVLYYTDTNTEHSCNWADSTLGQAWLAIGEVMWQERLILPGYESRQRYHPVGSPPFLMNNNKRAKTNHGSSNQGNQNQGNQGNQGNSNRGNQNQGTGNQGNYGNQGN